jgi:predicted ATP-dependent protease
MGKAKEHKSLTDNLERLEGMAMAAATSIAKLDKKYVEGQQGAEAMLMQAAMTNAKSAKDSSDRITNIESMLLSQAHSIGKVSVGFGRIVASETEAPILSANLL